MKLKVFLFKKRIILILSNVPYIRNSIIINKLLENIY